MKEGYTYPDLMLEFADDEDILASINNELRELWNAVHGAIMEAMKW